MTMAHDNHIRSAKLTVPGVEALHNLANALSEDVVRTPIAELIVEMCEDRVSPEALAGEFDRIIARRPEATQNSAFRSG